jgi:hypothetical protein
MSPIPEKIRTVDSAFYDRADWKSCWVFWPRRCYASRRWLWPGTLAYRGRAVWHGPGEPVLEEHWHECHEHLIWQLMVKE